jgi:Zn-dependent protease
LAVTDPGRAISSSILIWAPVLLFSMVAHEYAHAAAAYRQGDDTAFMLGRLTFNPLKHIDPMMTVIVPVVLWYASQGAFTFGAAKPVPVNPRKYRNYRRGDIIVSLAGIATNLGLYVAFALLFVVVGVVGAQIPALSASLAVFQRMLLVGMLLNLVLAFFNLLPIPPLDGSHVLKHFLPAQLGLQFRALYRGGFLLVIAFVYLFPGAQKVYLWPALQLFRVAHSLVGGYQLATGVTP